MELADLKRKWRALQKGGAGATPDVSIGVASSFTIDPLTPYLGAFLLSHGYARPAIGLADYNQIVQSCLSPGVAFGGVDPDVIILAWRLEDIAPSHTPAAMHEASELILSAVDALQRSFSGTIILCTPPRPAVSADGCSAGARATRSRGRPTSGWRGSGSTTPRASPRR